MAVAHNLGFPRIGIKRELKTALENYWQGKLDQNELLQVGKRIRAEHWALQARAGHDFVSVGDFSWYDHVLDTSALLGVVPKRFVHAFTEVGLDTYFRMARGRAPSGTDVLACEMTKWFDTNYHYLVPEFTLNQSFKISSKKIFDEVAEAHALGHRAKPILLGPLSYLWLGKFQEQTAVNKLILLKNILPVYQEILTRLRDQQVTWVQIDEPILVLDLPAAWRAAFRETYQQLQINQLNLLLTPYFGGLDDNLQLACELPTAGLHLDVVRAPQQLTDVLNYLPKNKILSVGIIDGRNVWRAYLRAALHMLQTVHQAIGERLWIASSCSLLHCPLDLSAETQLDSELKNWLAFVIQKLDEIAVLAKGIQEGETAIATQLTQNENAITSRKHSLRIHHPAVKQRCEAITPAMINRVSPFSKRRQLQQEKLNLPLFPTTTIGSFPQTPEVREVRRDFKNAVISADLYQEKICSQITHAIHQQQEWGLDVLVHGESERNDMVEYFGELLSGFAFTKNGWVQSYGSRCVKPPIIFGDVYREKPMSVEWIQYAQSLTDKPVKGMLTGPMTILCWSFVRDDQPRFVTAKQIALALRDEVDDLVVAGIQAIQIDEPAFREGLPLRKSSWQNYLENAVECFRLSSCSVPDDVQIHTHMCYSEFNDIIEAIAQLDADVITIETSRSNMELLQAFEQFHYPNDMGPGVYDIHSPRLPSVEEMVNLIEKAAHFIPAERLWINPDCGLKTRTWPETELALRNMVAAAKILRERYRAYKPSAGIAARYYSTG